FCVDHFASSFCDCLSFNVLPVMPRIKLRCIDEGNPIEVLSRLTVFQRGGVQRHPCFAKRFKSSAVNQWVLTVKQRCVDVSAGQLCRLCFCLGPCLVEISKVEPVTFAADVIGDAVVCSAWLLVSVNLHRGGTTFYDDRESVSLRVHSTIYYLELKCANIVRKVSEKASEMFNDTLFHLWNRNGSAYGSRTRAPALRGPCPNH